MGLDFTNTRAVRLLANLGGALLLAAAGQACAQPTGPIQTQTTNRLIVRFADPRLAEQQPPEPALLSTLEQAAGRPLHPVRRASGGALVVRIDTAVNLSEAARIAARIQRLSVVEHAQPDRRYNAQLIPDDPEFDRQWYLTDAGGGIDAQAAWDTTTGSFNSVIAVLDTGIVPHADLNGRVLPGYDFISDIATANDGDARDPDAGDPGDFVTEQESNNEQGPFFNCTVTDSSWHGTVISGILAANTNNGRGIAGIEHRAAILPVRVLGKCGGFVSDVADAIRWAAGVDDPALPDNTNPAGIINLSFGSEAECSETEQSAINDAVNAGALVVASAGNQGIDVSGFTPANCDNVVAVAAATRQGGETVYTNYGPDITLSAPGGNAERTEDGIRSTSNTGVRGPLGDAYTFVNGTSYAAPLVSGAAALTRAANPMLSPTDMRIVLISSVKAFPTGTTDSFGDCTVSRCGAGLLDARAAVVAAGEGNLGGSGDGRISMQAESVCVTEDDVNLDITVLRESGTGAISARVQTQRISATPDRDFQAVDQVLTWQDGDNEPKSFTIAINADTVVEGSEFFLVRLVNTSAAVELGSPDSTVVTVLSTDGNTPKACTGNRQQNNNGDNGGGNTSLFLIAGLLLLIARVRSRAV